MGWDRTGRASDWYSTNNDCVPFWAADSRMTASGPFGDGDGLTADHSRPASLRYNPL